MVELSPGSFAAFLKAHRMAAGITQRALAKAIDVTPQHMSDVEAGKRMPSTEVAEEIATALHLSQTDRERLIDLMATDKGAVAPDLTSYLAESELARVALRRASKAKLSPSGWHKVLDVIDAETDGATPSASDGGEA